MTFLPGRLRAILRDQMTGRRLRLTSGLILFAYVTGHFFMHALGNISWRAMEAGARIHDVVWHSFIGTWTLYGAFLIHFTLALWALYARPRLRMTAGEWTRLLLGFTILPLMIHHYAAGRFVYSVFGVQRDYDVVLTVYFGLRPFWGLRQIAAMLVVWTHGCLGIHFWLRSRAGYRRYQPVMLAAAVLLPAVALLGIWQGTREVLAYGRTNAEWMKELTRAGHMRDAALNNLSWTFEVYLYWIYAGLILLVFVARGIRHLIERRRGSISITYPGGAQVRVPLGFAVLDASLQASIPHASICGGRGRCTTCRIRVLRGIEGLPAPSPSESAALARLRAGPNVRLACQLRPNRDVSVLLLLPPDVAARERQESGLSSERFVAIMFVDIRQSTAMVEKRLPYDVVFLLNHFFEAVAGAVLEVGGKPNQFLGDGMMAIFDDNPREACRKAIAAANLIHRRLEEFNAKMADELAQPIAIGIGVHAGTVIFGELGYRDHFVMTAIGDPVHVAARLQDMTKEYECQLLISEVVAETANMDLTRFPQHEVRVRGRAGVLNIRTVKSVDDVTVPHIAATASTP